MCIRFLLEKSMGRRHFEDLSVDEKNMGRSVCIAPDHGSESRGSISRKDKLFFMFSLTYKLALGPTEPPVQWLSRAVALGVMRPGS
jgi:hypothetical protein